MGTLQLWHWIFSAVQEFETIKCQHQGCVSDSSTACCAVAGASIQQSYREISIKAELQRDHRPVLVGYFNRDQRNSGKLVTDEVADEESIKTLDLQVGRKKICTEGYAVVWHAASFGLVRVSVSVTASNITVRLMCERLWDTELKSHWDSLFSCWLQADVTQPAGFFFHCLIVSFATFLIHYLLCFYMNLLNLYLIYY